MNFAIMYRLKIIITVIKSGYGDHVAGERALLWFCKAEISIILLLLQTLNIPVC
jgi:hypothetical protein